MRLMQPPCSRPHKFSFHPPSSPLYFVGILARPVLHPGQVIECHSPVVRHPSGSELVMHSLTAPSKGERRKDREVVLSVETFE